MDVELERERIVMSVFHDEVEIEDFEYDPETETYYYPCPCGDLFEISKVRCCGTGILMRLVLRRADTRTSTHVHTPCMYLRTYSTPIHVFMRAQLQTHTHMEHSIDTELCLPCSRILQRDLEDGEEIATCPSCSLIVRVIYDPVS